MRRSHPRTGPPRPSDGRSPPPAARTGTRRPRARRGDPVAEQPTDPGGSGDAQLDPRAGGERAPPERGVQVERRALRVTRRLAVRFGQAGERVQRSVITVPFGKPLAIRVRFRVRLPMPVQVPLTEPVSGGTAGCACRSSRRRRCRAPRGCQAGSRRSCRRSPAGADAVAVAVGVDRVDPGAVLVDPVVRHVGDARADRGVGVVAVAGRRTPSLSASPSISSHETRVSASSEIAVSFPSPHSTCSAWPSRRRCCRCPRRRGRRRPRRRRTAHRSRPPSKSTGIVMPVLTDATSFPSPRLTRKRVTPALGQSTVFGFVREEEAGDGVTADVGLAVGSEPVRRLGLECGDGVVLAAVRRVHDRRCPRCSSTPVAWAPAGPRA